LLLATAGQAGIVPAVAGRPEGPLFERRRRVDREIVKTKSSAVQSNNTLWTVAERLAKSGCYDGASAAAIYPRLLVGQALSVDHATAASNITVSRGKVVISASLQGAQHARSSGYTMVVEEVTEEKAVLSFINKDQPTGTATYTIAEAKRAGLTSKSVWTAYPSDLLFARALTRGIKRFAPDLLVGNPAVTAEELGEDVHEVVERKEEVPAVAEDKKSPPKTTATDKPARGTITDQQLHDLKCAKELLEIPTEVWRDTILHKRGVTSALALSTEAAGELIAALKTRINVQQMQEAMAQRDAEVFAQQNGDLTMTLPPSTKGGKASAESKSAK
jgi:hypothetical protein